ncbi:MAG: FecR family protein [Gammaproteobacteria bacterium]|nr:FecR family protein [Gammaproteobacteria bacterium]
MPSIAFPRLSTSLLLLTLCALWLGGCAPSNRLTKVVRADPSAPLGYVEVHDRDSGIVAVIRGGRRLGTRTPLTLQPGDEVRTGPGAGAVIRLLNGGEVVLAPDTHVRLGSLEVFFGRVLADLRGLFEIEDDTLVAAVEGTRLLFERERGRSTRVAVLEGRVLCIPKRGHWEPVRLNDGQALRTRYASDRRPAIERLSRAEIADIERWSSGIRDAARAGFCCAGGRVTETLSNQCRGRFFDSERRARRHCESGWCCRNGSVTSSLRGDCRGSFHNNRTAAERACAPPEPAVVQGWCCLQGNLRQTDSRYCKAVQGQFYTNGAVAKRRCLPVVQ